MRTRAQTEATPTHRATPKPLFGARALEPEGPDTVAPGPKA